MKPTVVLLSPLVASHPDDECRHPDRSVIDTSAFITIFNKTSFSIPTIIKFAALAAVAKLVDALL